jgi:hypothetical protein
MSYDTTQQLLLGHSSPAAIAAAEVLGAHPVLEFCTCPLEAAVCIAVRDELITIHKPHTHADIDVNPRLEPAQQSKATATAAAAAAAVSTGPSVTIPLALNMILMKPSP